MPRGVGALGRRRAALAPSCHRGERPKGTHHKEHKASERGRSSTPRTSPPSSRTNPSGTRPWRTSSDHIPSPAITSLAFTSKARSSELLRSNRVIAVCEPPKPESARALARRGRGSCPRRGAGDRCRTPARESSPPGRCRLRCSTRCRRCGDCSSHLDVASGAGRAPRDRAVLAVSRRAAPDP